MHGNTYDIDDLIAGEIKEYDNNTDTYVRNTAATNNIINGNKLRKVYLTALAREKYDLYRPNTYFTSTGEMTYTTSY